MPVLLKFEDIPERFLYQFMKASLLPMEELPSIVPAYSFFGILRLPSAGFIVSPKRVVIYETRIFVGLAKHGEFPLQNIEKLETFKERKQTVFRFDLKDGTQYSVSLNLSDEECELLAEKLREMADVQKRQ